MSPQRETTHLKREILVRIIKAFLKDDFINTVDKIPYDMRPKGAEVPYRCCIYKERAILRDRAIAGLGFSLENDDEAKHLGDYAKEALEREKVEETTLTVIGGACKGCVPSRMFVTDLCQGCVARPCVSACAFGAISIQNGKSVIDASKCKNCTKCMLVCPYKAIAKVTVPCEEACPVKAIAKDENGFAKIDFDKCISCGACVSMCPFGAVHEKSQIIEILKAIKSDKKVVAMVAPSVVGQLPATLEQLACGLKCAGFDEVMEVAVGADITALNEAKDFHERIQERGDKFMTTSCCAAYIELSKKHLPEIQPYMSETKTPMYYSAELAKKKDPECVTVFVGPCVAKRKEGLMEENVDYVMSYEEMGALFVALKIELSECNSYTFDNPASAQGRGFGITGGVAQSVKVASSNNENIKPHLINGLNIQSIRQLKNWAKNGECPEGNLVEVMACPGGCVGGACVINTSKSTVKKINELIEKSDMLKANNDSACKTDS